MKKHRLSAFDFASVRESSGMSEASLAIASRVLVDGERQIDVSRAIGTTRQYVSMIVNQFWDHFDRHQPLPKDWATSVVTLPIKDWPKVHELEQRARAALPKKLSAH